jgi:leader peptidase (prepilin peptidase) / N-methyltransferase
VNFILTMPIELRLAAMFVVGTVLGGLANLGTYRLAWNPRPISPWSRPDPKHTAPARRWTDRVPIFGWLGMRREASLHGAGFWIRPLLVELSFGFGLAWLYWWEIDQLGLLPASMSRVVPAEWMGVLHVQFAVHVLLIWLMLVASLIDADEKTIPDAITVPGTLLGLLLAAVLPLSLLPDMSGWTGLDLGARRHLWQVISPDTWPLMVITAPNEMPDWLGGFPRGGSLALGLGCWWLWCFGLMRRDWHGCHGLRRASGLFLLRLWRERSTWWILAMGLVGSAAIAGVWLSASRGWTSLVTALVGIAAAGGLVWVVRVIAGAVLQREAMGFGDVTLMAMIGAFVGWQAAVLIFFAAPLAALVVGLFILLLFRDREIPYGPFLCLAALGILLCWSAVWDWASDRFEPGWLVPAVLLGCPVLLGLLLAMIQGAKRLFGYLG